MDEMKALSAELVELGIIPPEKPEQDIDGITQRETYPAADVVKSDPAAVKESIAHRSVKQRQTSESRRRISAIMPCLPFFIALAVLTVCAWLIPLRPEISEGEKRQLEQFPQFSFEAVLDGSFFRGVDAWFSDTFTFRESWISLADEVEGLHGSGSVVIYGDISVSEQIPAVEQHVTDKTETVTNKTELPDVSAQPDTGAAGNESVQNTQPDTIAGAADDVGAEIADDPSETPQGGADLPGVDEGTAEPAVTDTPSNAEGVSVENGGQDQQTDEWGGETINEDEFFSQGAVIQIDDAVYAVPGFSEYQCSRFISSMNTAAELLEGKANLYTMTAPTNITYMFSRSDREFMGLTLEEDGLEYMYEQMDEGVNTVNVFNTLVEHNDEYICFRTDHHWTALGAYYAYVEWCNVAGIEPVPLDAYETVEYGGYLGTTYYKAQKSSIVEKNPDTVVCYIPPGDVHLYLNEGGGDDLGYENDIITNRTNSSSGSKFLAFLAGDHAKCTFVNNDITDGSACLVVKNSQGNPFVYFLTQHYQYVYVIDPRYYFKRDLVSFVDKFEIDDVIFCTSAGFTWGTGGNDLIGAFVK